jgi:hypothetical protein
VSAGITRLLYSTQFSGTSDTTVFDNVKLVLAFTTPAIPIISNLTFQNMPGNIVQFDLSSPGAVSAFSLTNLTFTSVPTSGVYLRATDTAPTDGNILTVDMINPNPATSGGFIQQINAVIHWP